MATAEREAEARAEGPLGSGTAPNRTGPQRSGGLLFLYRVSLLILGIDSEAIITVQLYPSIISLYPHSLLRNLNFRHRYRHSPGANVASHLAMSGENTKHSCILDAQTEAWSNEIFTFVCHFPASLQQNKASRVAGPGSFSQITAYCFTLFLTQLFMSCIKLVPDIFGPTDENPKEDGANQHSSCDNIALICLKHSSYSPSEYVPTSLA